MIRVVLGAAVVTVLTASLPPAAMAVPPPPPNPSDTQLTEATSAADGQAAQVGQLIKNLTTAQAELDQLAVNVGVQRELANKARVDLEEARAGADAADQAVVNAQHQVLLSQDSIESARRQVDQLAAGSYQQGSTVGSFSAYLGSESPEDVLARAQLLNAVTTSQLGVMETLQRARAQSANAESAARAAKTQADSARAQADAAKGAADQATQNAMSAQQAQAAQTAQLQANRDQAQYALDQARTAVSGLQGQRQAFEQWDTQRRAEEAAAAQRAAEEAARQRAAAEAAAQAQAAADAVNAQQAADASAARQRAAAQAAAAQTAAAQTATVQAAAPRPSAPRPSTPQAVPAPAPVAAPVYVAPAPVAAPVYVAPPKPAPAPVRTPPRGNGGSSTGSVQTVINRAMSQLGVPYSWGGGNAYGATVGIRDGGVADSFGDYAKVGFDCSGLMVYAFAGVGISLRHYTGYQYESGTKVPISQMRPGDMIFWGPYDIHHVALYLGDGKMIEAPQSGSYVKISPVRYGGIMPYAVRML
ncbi:NlpC/P60 family protein [Rhodococcus sp. X156]|uniref:NlpC/P60 family protein n=1 Tax=Rhodococcus sp. X156 TaxID=2499145 RepID=UPI000FDBCE5B|nr:NlpC/P60 family protein [Rhodococcus sp. X156]